ncbi:hypothetical protein DH2020_036100 [Rehmannia glutinosa]|uniref:Uncharacterized protein n=1 Tax=Rehmannia glutinosa TaxID=99300 RepID=A0ABR0V7U1_REHGL
MAASCYGMPSISSENEIKETAAAPPKPTPPPKPKGVLSWIIGEHKLLRRVGLQRARPGENQRSAGDDRVRDGVGSGISQRTGYLRPNSKRWNPMVSLHQRFANRGVSGSDVSGRDCGIEIGAIDDIRCGALERKVCDVGPRRIGSH